MVWDLDACITYLTEHSQRGESAMELLLARVHELRGAPQLDDDFSIIEAHFR